MDMYGFYTGQEFEAHEYLGAHIVTDGVVFRTFAPPNVARVCLLLNGEEIPMERVYDSNFHQVTAENARVGDFYEYRIYFHDGGWCDHCDPYGFQMELRPAHRSIVCDLSAYRFRDCTWMKKRTNCLDKPLNIYEMHLGSWRQKENRDWYTYTETAKELIPYLKASGFVCPGSCAGRFFLDRLPPGGTVRLCHKPQGQGRRDPCCIELQQYAKTLSLPRVIPGKTL